MPIYDFETYNEITRGSKTKNPLPKTGECVTSNYPRVLHNETTWRFLQNTYHELKGAGKKSYHHRIHARHRYLYYNGLLDSIAARNDIDGRGRTLYAIEPIKWGEITWWYSESGTNVTNSDNKNHQF